MKRLTLLFFICTFYSCLSLSSPFPSQIQEELFLLKKRWQLTGELALKNSKPNTVNFKDHPTSKAALFDDWKTTLVSYQNPYTVLNILNGAENELEWSKCIQHSDKSIAIFAAKHIQDNIINRIHFNKILSKKLDSSWQDIAKDIEPIKQTEEALQLYFHEWFANIPPHSQKNIHWSHIKILKEKIKSSEAFTLNQQAENIETSQQLETFTFDYFEFIHKISYILLQKKDIDHTMPHLIFFLYTSFSPKALAKIMSACEVTLYWKNLESGLLCYFTHLQAATSIAIKKKEQWSQNYWHKEIYDIL